MIQESDLSPDQRIPYNQILGWASSFGSTRVGAPSQLPGQEDPYVLTLGGYAGTGKSTLVGTIASKLDSSRIAFCAYTGKAAHVLRGKLADQEVYPGYCGTIHGLIYATLIDEKGRASYSQVDSIPHIDLIVVDEASMVPENMFDELRSYDIPILAVGDHGQLPPVASSFNLMENPLLRLEKIHRQAESNPIIQLSAHIRKTGELLRDLEGEHICFLTTEEGDDEAMRSLFEATRGVEQMYDQAVIVYRNQTRVARNAHARNIRFGFGGAALPPQKNEQVICLRNDRLSMLFNGMRGHFAKEPTVYGKHKFEVDVRIHDESREVQNLKISRFQFGCEHTFSQYSDLTPYGFTPYGWSEVGGLFDYGYTLTCHKAQGSQFTDVLLVYEKPQRMNDFFRRWLYTSVTRASERIAIVMS